MFILHCRDQNVVIYFFSFLCRFYAQALPCLCIVQRYMAFPGMEEDIRELRFKHTHILDFDVIYSFSNFSG